MNANYHILQTVNRLGREVTLTPKSSTSTYDPRTRTLTNSTESPLYTFKGYYSSYSIEELESNLITSGDMKLLIPTTDTRGNSITRVNAGDFVTSPKGTMKIKSVEAIYEASTIVCYICQVGI